MSIFRITSLIFGTLALASLYLFACGTKETADDDAQGPVGGINNNPKPKDAYNLCFCLDNAPGGIEARARAWREWRDNPLVAAAIVHIREKFAAVNSYGPQQVALFREATSHEEQEMHARRAFELVARFLELIG